ncbi:MAG: hypothetical protein ACRDSG_03625, partial [Pseudonocardiaceae bacterium]
DRVTPLGEAGDHRLPRIQLRRYHPTIVTPTTDNFGASPQKPDQRYAAKRGCSMIDQLYSMAARRPGYDPGRS